MLSREPRVTVRVAFCGAISGRARCSAKTHRRVWASELISGALSIFPGALGKSDPGKSPLLMGQNLPPVFDCQPKSSQYRLRCTLFRLQPDQPFQMCRTYSQAQSRCAGPPGWFDLPSTPVGRKSVGRNDMNRTALKVIASAARKMALPVPGNMIFPGTGIGQGVPIVCGRHRGVRRSIPDP